MTCPNCGSPTRSGAAFCGECGENLIKPVAEAPRAVPATGLISAPSFLTTTPPPSEPEAVQVAMEAPVFVSPVPLPPVAPPTSRRDPALDETRAAPRRAREWVLTLSDGSTRAVTRTVLVGRDPAPHPDHPGAALFVVDDPMHSVSKMHAVLIVDATGLAVEDLGSTNGVVVVAPDGTESESQPGRRITVASGSEIELGQVVLTVTLV